MNLPLLSRNNSKTDPLNPLLFPTLENFTEINIDVAIMLPTTEQYEYIPEMRVLLLENNKIDLSDLINSLKFMGFSIKDDSIYHYNYLMGAFNYCGRDPLPTNTAIDWNELAFFNNRYQITIKISDDRNDPTGVFPAIEEPLEIENVPLEEILKPEQIESEDTFMISDQEELAENNSISTTFEDTNSKNKRIKERKVGQVMELVALWRKYYQGFTDPETGTLVKMSLQDAAAKVGVSKKSLDDYLLQIRSAMKYGFDFNANLDKSAGNLRSFVKKKKTSKNSKSSNKDSSASPKISAEFAKLFEKKTPKDNQRDVSERRVGISTRSKKI